MPSLNCLLRFRNPLKSSHIKLFINNLVINLKYFIKYDTFCSFNLKFDAQSLLCIITNMQYLAIVARFLLEPNGGINEFFTQKQNIRPLSAVYSMQ